MDAEYEGNLPYSNLGVKFGGGQVYYIVVTCFGCDMVLLDSGSCTRSLPVSSDRTMQFLVSLKHSLCLYLVQGAWTGLGAESGACGL